MKKNAAKKLTYVSRACMTVLTTVLIVLFFCIMSLVGKIQGTARVVNYAGLVRGTHAAHQSSWKACQTVRRTRLLEEVARRS